MLANHLKNISEDMDVERVRTSLPQISNLQHISDHCKSCAEGILTMHDKGSHEDLVREIYLLSFKHYTCILQQILVEIQKDTKQDLIISQGLFT